MINNTYTLTEQNITTTAKNNNNNNTNTNIATTNKNDEKRYIKLGVLEIVYPYQNQTRNNKLPKNEHSTTLQKFLNFLIIADED